MGVIKDFFEKIKYRHSLKELEVRIGFDNELPIDLINKCIKQDNGRVRGAKEIENAEIYKEYYEKMMNAYPNVSHVQEDNEELEM